MTTPGDAALAVARATASPDVQQKEGEKMAANDARQREHQQIIDPAVASEIPEDVLKAALGEDEGGRRRTSRVTKARVIMIDGHLCCVQTTIV